MLQNTEISEVAEKDNKRQVYFKIICLAFPYQNNFLEVKG